MSTRPVALVLAILMAAPFVQALPVTPADLQNDCGSGADAGDSLDAALAIALPAVCVASLAHDDARDVFAFDAVKDQRVDYKLEMDNRASALSRAVLSLTLLQSDLKLCFVAPSGATDCPAPHLADYGFSFRAGETGRYHARVDAAGAKRFEYRLEVAAAGPPMHDDCATGQDAGETSASALRITAPAACDGVAFGSYRDFADWFVLHVPAGQRVALTGASDAPYGGTLCLGPASGQRCTRQTGTISLVGYALAAGDWYVGLPNAYNAAYRFTVTVEPIPPADDCGTGGDAGGDHAAAALVALPVACRGVLQDLAADGEDWFAFAAAEGQVLSARMTPDAVTDLCLHRPDGTLHECRTSSSLASHALFLPLDQTGDWRLQLKLRAPYGEYALTASLATPTPGAQDDCGTGTDAPDARQHALVLAAPVAGCLGAADGASLDLEDWYAVDVAAGQPLHVLVAPEEGSNVDTCLFAPGASAPTECRTTGGAFPEEFERVSGVDGSWRIRVTHRSGPGAYALSLDLEGVQDDCGSGRDAGADAATAVALATPTVRCEAAFPPLLFDREDWYRLDVPADATRITAQTSIQPVFGVELCLVAPGASTATACASSTASVATITHDVAGMPGAWHVRLRLLGGAGTYHVSAALT